MKNFWHIAANMQNQDFVSLFWHTASRKRKELNARQKVQRGDGSDPTQMKGLKEATAVLKDLAAVAKTLNDQGADAEARACGVVLLPAVEDV